MRFRPVILCRGTDPTGGHTWYLPVAYARMLGLGSSALSTDDTVTLNSSYNWSFGQDVTSILEHEISEGVMGRVGGLGDQNGVWSTMDLFRFSSPGVRDFTDGRDGLTTHFSVNGSPLSSLSFNNEFLSNGTQANFDDTADFTQSDVYGTNQAGETDTLSQTDITVMDALGWTQRTSPSPEPGPPNISGTQAGHFEVHDNTTGQITEEAGTPYTGPVAGLTSEFIDLNPDNLDIAAITPNSFIYSGLGNDAINVGQAGGNNVLDATGGSNFLVGGGGDDTFFLNDLNPAAPIWSTLVNFHAGDAATIWGVTPADFSSAWAAGEGAAEYTGLTLQLTAAGKPAEYLTLAGMTPADLSNGRLTVQYGTASTGVPYMEISRL